MSYSITKNGKKLDKKLYTIDIKNKTFSSKESCLVLDFSNEYGWYFKTGYDCTFNTLSYCTFDTGSDCTFNTLDNCAFKTGSDCTFDTVSDCTFNTLDNCTFNTEDDCTFKTLDDCTFKTGSSCTFTTGYDCTFNTLSYCTFDTGSDCTFNTLDNCAFIVCDNLVIKLVKDSCILLKKIDKTEILDLNYFIEKNTSLEGFQLKIKSKEDLNLLSNLKTNNDFMLNLRKNNVKNFMDFINKS